MKKQVFLFAILLLFSTVLQAQSLKKYPIGKTKYNAYFFCAPPSAEISYSPDSSIIYNMSCIKDSTTYGLNCIVLKMPLKDIKVAEELAIKFCNYLQKKIDVVSTAGYGKGHTNRTSTKAIGFIDYWKDKTNNEIKMKCWTDGNVIAVLYAIHYKALPDKDFNKVELFLNGFDFGK